MTAIPPVSVRFVGETDGVAIAVRALTSEIRGLSSVQRQNARDAEAMAASGKKIASQFSQAGAALGALGTTIGVARLTGLLTDAIDTGDALFKLSQKTGASTEALSVIAFAGRTADVTLDDLTTTLKFLSKSLGDLQRGEPAVVAGFQALGLSARDLKGLTVDQAFVKIANAQANFADSTGKAEAALRIFGRSGSEIIPLLKDLADGGFDRAAEAATRLNLVWSHESAKAAQDFNDSITILKASGEGLAGVFAKEVIPTITNLATGTAQLVSSLPGPLKELVTNLFAVEGAIVGITAAIRLLKFAGIGAAFTPVGLAVLAIGTLAAELLKLSANAAEAKAKYSEFIGTLKDTGAIDDEKQKLELALAANQAAIDATTSDLRRLGLLKERQRIEEQLAELDKQRAAIGAPNRPGAVVADPAAAAAARAAQLAAIQQEHRLNQARNQAFEQANQEQFDRGEQGLKDYFRRRLGLTQDGINDELQALSDERRIIESTPAPDAAAAVKKQEDLKPGGRLDREADRISTEGEAKKLAIVEQERQAEKTEAEERLAFEQKILQARGEQLQATLDGLELEARKFNELLVKQGVPAAERSSRVADFRAALTLRANFDNASEESQRALADIDAERERIAQQVQIGVLTERQGQQQLAAIEAARLPTLREMAAQMLKFANQLGNEQLIQAAEALGVQVEGIAASANLAGQETARLKSNLLDATQRSVATLLGSGVDQLGAPNPDQDTITRLQQQQQEIARQIQQFGDVSGDSTSAAALKVRELSAEYDELSGKIKEAQSRTKGLFDVLKDAALDLANGIRQALNELIAQRFVDVLSGAGGGVSAARRLVQQDFGLEAGRLDLTPAASAAPQVADLQSATAPITTAAGALAAAGTTG
ncbi:MAG: hypothetical protein ACREOQ_06265, partial [Gemmatimonadales bacterium]